MLFIEWQLWPRPRSSFQLCHEPLFTTGNLRIKYNSVLRSNIQGSCFFLLGTGVASTVFCSLFCFCLVLASGPIFFCQALPSYPVVFCLVLASDLIFFCQVLASGSVFFCMVLASGPVFFKYFPLVYIFNTLEEDIAKASSLETLKERIHHIFY